MRKPKHEPAPPSLIKMPGETGEQFAKRKAEVEKERQEVLNRKVDAKYLGHNKRGTND
jgi:hypothetical protein